MTVMAYGDAIMATSLARGLHAQGKLAAFYEKKGKIRWTEYCEQIFTNNPNIARPGMEKKSNLVWFQHYKKKIAYAKFDGNRWVWDYTFKAQAGEFFFASTERLPASIKEPFIVIEPNVAWNRLVSVNKDWGNGNYEKLAKALIDGGRIIVQFIHNNSRRRINGAHQVVTKTFHEAAAIMSRASLVIAPEGANHHAAAALNIPAVILWGGYSPPQIMGYDGQIKLTGNASEACGTTGVCSHCRDAMKAISVDEVYEAAIRELN